MPRNFARRRPRFLDGAGRAFTLQERLRQIGAEVLSPWGAGERSGIVVFRHGEDPAALADFLHQNGFIVRCRGGGVRAAPHFYIDEGDLDRLVDAVRDARV